MKRIDPETRKMLKSDLGEYLQRFPDATREEKHKLRRWVAAGRSPYDNQWELYNDYGWPMDFITAERIGKEMVAESKNSSAFLFEQASSEIDCTDDLPF